MRRIRYAAAVAAAVVVLMPAAACSSGESTPEESSTSVEPASHGSYAQCLSEHGVPTAPGPVVGAPPGVDPETWTQAVHACSSLAPGPG
ncbi:hypothetical protein M1247_31215 [Mycobacterium sp. 21AC1]|uniref:hypothetical protein n=1 Tax=[Mycobacterium] appelbergii TaxID=2939269 RepID=UPI0029390BC0|nr:hypothetical protein [Mycobacterium sp. 21AC1]MDV3129412.1 hypothetical protein [Mycobacterium sp. 21AC1]